MAVLSTFILQVLPTANPVVLSVWDKAGIVCNAEAKQLVSTKTISVDISPPSLARLQNAVEGTQIADKTKAGYDFLIGLSLGFDTAQTAVQASFAGGSPVPVPPDLATLTTLINQTSLASLISSKPWGITGLNPNSLLLCQAFANFIIANYFT